MDNLVEDQATFKMMNSLIFDNFYETDFEQFKLDLYRSFGVLDKPKAPLAFKIAWKKGHSSGYTEVINEFTDLVELIK